MECIKAMRARWLHLVVTLVSVLWSGAADAAVTYDMLDYMRHDTAGIVNNLTIRINGQNTNQIQMIGDYKVGPKRFYITKNWNGSGATEFEEFEWDANYIYLVRDTSWQQHAWCDGQDTSFELWTNGVNRGAWIPRYVTSGMVYTTPMFEIRARKEGGSCATCNSAYDSDGAQNNARRIRATHWNSITLNTHVLYDIVQISVLDGPGMGEEYFFSKTLGWVGYRDPAMASYFSGLAGGGEPLYIAAHDVCPIKNPDMEKTATSMFGGIAAWGPNGGWAKHTDYPRAGNSTLGNNFGFYAAGTTEKVGQVLNMRFASNKTYMFGSYAQGGGDNSGLLPYEIGYASTDGNLNSFVLLARTSWVVGADWSQKSGVTYSTGSSGAAIGKQIIVRFGSNGVSDIWFDNLSLTVY